MRPLADLFRLILLVLLLPVILILIGPLLVLAALRGRQRIGPITLDAARSSARRTGALVVGLLLWLLVWGGLAWLAWAALGTPPTVAQQPAQITATPAPTQTALAATATERPQPSDTPTRRPTLPPAASTSTGQPETEIITPTRHVTATMVAVVAVTSTAASDTPTHTATLSATPEPTATSVPPTATPTDTLTPIPLPTATPVPPTATPTFTSTPAPPTATPTFTSTPVPPTATPTFTPTPTVTPTDTATPRPTATPTPTDTATPTVTPTPTVPATVRQAAIAAVEAGNDLLHDAIIEATEDNLQKMDTVWQDKALPTARAFATDIYDRYAKPLRVDFEYLKRPAITEQLSGNRLVVTSSERWSYGGPTKTDYQEAFQFIYTLTRRSGQWVITEYSFLNLPLLKATPTRTATPHTQGGG